MKFLDDLVWSNRWSLRILRHSLFWIFDCIGILIVISADNEFNANVILSRVLVIPFTAFITYLIIYYIIPSYSRNQNLVRLLLGVFFALLFVAYGIRYYRLYVVNPFIDPNYIVLTDIWSFKKIVRDTFRWIPGISLAIAIKMMKNRSEMLNREQQLIEEKKKAELAFLKAQMHPHFLFNTLNTLYSYSVKNNNGIESKSEQIILRLSNLMRFILEECDKQLIPVENEIKVIEDYFQLEKLRHGDRLQLDYRIELGRMVYISPLLLLPIVENSCKHTLSSKRGRININLSIKSDIDFIRLYMENDFIQEEKIEGTHGKGLSSVNRQLHLLYGSDFHFETRNINDKFVVDLKIPAKTNNE